MKVIVIIDEYLDEREFRNYSSYWLSKLGFANIKIEDPRLADNDPLNDNDMLATKKKKNYTVQSFLNKEITEKEVIETIDDMLKEKVDNGIIITNTKVSNEFKKYAEEKSIEIIDREKFTEKINEKDF